MHSVRPDSAALWKYSICYDLAGAGRHFTETFTSQHFGLPTYITSNLTH